MEKEVIEKIDEQIKEVLNNGINTNNVEYLCKLAKIKHYAKEDESMNYGNYGAYGRGPSRGAYGENYNRGGYGENYNDSYGRRGYDMRYRGDESLDRMYGEYGRYQASRGSYGHGDETDKSFHYMVKSLEDFIKVLHEEAETPMQKQALKESLQRSMM